MVFIGKLKRLIWFFRKLESLKITASTALIKNSAGEYLFVKPAYRDDFQLPGGYAHTYEDPKEAVVREVKEELGIDVKVSRLLDVDHLKGLLIFLYELEPLSDEKLSSIVLEEGEIESHKYVSGENLDMANINSYVLERVKKII